MALGGPHLQFNMVDAETLEEAQEHPDEHKNLMVRVAGYSAFFVQLNPAGQNEVICRTHFNLHN